MGRRFLIGAAIAIAVLALGLQLESRMPDQAGPGEETVAFHGFCVFRQEIKPADAEQHSPYPALAVAGGVIAAAAIVAGTLVMLLGRPWRHACSQVQQ